LYCNTEARDSDNDFFNSCSSPTPQKSLLEQINPTKRPKEPSTSSESPSPTVQKPKTTKLRRTSNVPSETMDPAMQKFFRDLILESEERTKNVIKSETASVKDSVSKAIDSLEKNSECTETRTGNTTCQIANEKHHHPRDTT
jgi:hypothetical protein